jgi:hypothetical protein
VAFEEIKDSVAAILGYPAKKEDRIKKWRTEASRGNIGPNPFQISRYKPETWMKQSAVLNSSEKSTDAFGSNLYRFYQAASIHRQFVLRELLPENKLVVA